MMRKGKTRWAMGVGGNSYEDVSMNVALFVLAIVFGLLFYQVDQNISHEKNTCINATTK